MEEESEAKRGVVCIGKKEREAGWGAQDLGVSAGSGWG